MGYLALRRDGAAPNVDVDVAHAYMVAIDAVGGGVSDIVEVTRLDGGKFNVDGDVAGALMIAIDAMGSGTRRRDAAV